MSKKSQIQGRAFEYITLMTLYNYLVNERPVWINRSSALEVAESDFHKIDDELKATMTTAAKAIIPEMVNLEPWLIEGNDVLYIYIQADSNGELGDVRDIIIERTDIKWQIGLSIKHNHFAIKHSRLSMTIDFGNKWFGHKCSQTYWSEISPIFTFLSEQKKLGTKWSDIQDKDNTIYVPILTAFKNEVLRCASEHNDIPRKMVEYLLGEYDFYKITSEDNKETTLISVYNLRGTLNYGSKYRIPSVNLPTRIISLDFKLDSTNTLEMYMDKGWQFSFRIHNAATTVEPSLKFDIQIIGMPVSIVHINCFWANVNKSIL